MPFRQLNFRHVGFHLGRIDDEHRFSFWSDDPNGFNFDGGRLLVVDTSKAAAEYLAGKISINKLQLGVCARKGPYPSTPGPFAGDLTIFEEFWKKSKAETKVAWPPTSGGRPYEFMETLYFDDDGAGPLDDRNKRWFRGFHAVVKQATANDVTLDIYDGGRSYTDPPKVKEQIIPRAELADAKLFDLHASKGGRTEIDPDDPQASSGALFIEVSKANTFKLTIPKLPPGAGDGAIPNRP